MFGPSVEDPFICATRCSGHRTAWSLLYECVFGSLGDARRDHGQADSPLCQLARRGTEQGKGELASARKYETQTEQCPKPESSTVSVAQ